MILGTIASSYRAAAQWAGDQTGSALVYVDFTTQTYALNGVSVALTDIFSNISQTIDANGLLLDSTASPATKPPKFTHEASDAVNLTGCECTVIAEFLSRASGAVTPFNMNTNYLDSSYAIGTFSASIYAYDTQVTAEINLDFDPNITLAINPGPAWNTIRRCAMRVSKSGNALSVNGSVPDVDTSPYIYGTPEFEHITIGGWDGDSALGINAYFRKLMFYPALSNSDLQLYSNL